ncbi:hypothetical protein [Leucobacter musarum]|uniref:hypothetical protein n=1 Tax=Leucobacter musarum TaxID=1930747 RepID=UPI0006A76607|nr:hypothetical protein [Leucobacter musarum]
MRRLLIPRSFFGFVIRIAVLNALLGAGTYATALLIAGARIALALQIIEFTRLVDAVNRFVPIS